MGVFPHIEPHIDPHSDDQGQQNYKKKGDDLNVLDKPHPKMNLPWHFYSGSCGRIS